MQKGFQRPFSLIFNPIQIAPAVILRGAAAAQMFRGFAGDAAQGGVVDGAVLQQGHRIGRCFIAVVDAVAADVAVDDAVGGHAVQRRVEIFLEGEETGVFGELAQRNDAFLFLGVAHGGFQHLAHVVDVGAQL